MHMNPFDVIEKLTADLSAAGAPLADSMREIVAQVERLDSDTQRVTAKVVRPLVTGLRRAVEGVAAPLRDAESKLSRFADSE